MPEIIIPGTPIAKKRPRFFRRGNHVGTYNNQETEEGRAMLEIKSQWPGEPLAGPVRLCMEFIFPRPKSHFGAGKNADRIKSSAPVVYLKKPDLDNLEKFAMDCMSGIVFVDDCQDVQIASGKTWSASGGKTIIHIEEV